MKLFLLSYSFNPRFTSYNICYSAITFFINYHVEAFFLIHIMSTPQGHIALRFVYQACFCQWYSNSVDRDPSVLPPPPHFSLLIWQGETFNQEKKRLSKEKCLSSEFMMEPTERWTRRISLFFLSY